MWKVLAAIAIPACLAALGQPQPILIQYERPGGFLRPAADACPSKLTVFESGEVVYETLQGASCGRWPGAVTRSRWDAAWDTAPGEKIVTRRQIPAAEMAELKKFLERADVARIGPFMNAGPGVGDFRVVLRGTGGVHEIDVIALMPTHEDLIAHPALLHVVCRGKELARSATPEWCKNLKPLTQ